jgi:Tol biopolymer transport system component
MALTPGSRLGPYEILSAIGAGGMGEVYRARDPRLGREVAIKVLPSSFSADADRLRRFEQEAKAAGVLNHPNVTAVYDIGQHEGAPYVVQELLEGETLRSVLAGGRLSPRRAIDYSVQIAHGLAAAHEKGIVHRDLKPDNLFVTNDGRIKILDFGLAKLTQMDEGSAPQTSLPTASAGTEPGVVMGTLGYMSPEQVRGRPADARSDLFAFGAILYEMLSGNRAFSGDSAADTMSSILKEDPPDLSITNQSISPALERIVRHCLEKNPERRLHSAHDLAFELEALSTASSGGIVRPAPAGRVSKRQVALAAAALAVPVLLGIGFLAGRRARGASGPAPRTFLQVTDLPGTEAFPSLSPNGDQLAFTHATSPFNADIYVQRVGGQNPLNLTKDSPKPDYQPAFSPDGSSIAFRSERDGGGIYLMGSTGESVRRLTDFGFNPAWMPGGKQLVVGTESAFAPYGRANASSELWVIDTATGAKRKIFAGDAVQPSVSPHGTRIAYWGLPRGSSQRDVWTIPAGGLPAGEKPVPVTQDAAIDWNPFWSADGKSLYFGSNREGTMNLWRVSIDERSGKPLGPPEPLSLPAREILQSSISADGRHIAFRVVEDDFSIERVTFDPAAEKVVSDPVSLARATSPFLGSAISPDGKTLVYGSFGAREDLFLGGVDGTGHRKLTDDASRDRNPTFSTDGRKIFFQSDRSGRWEIWSIAPDGSGLAQVTKTTGETPAYPVCSPDGKRLAFIYGVQTRFLELGARDYRLSDPLPAPPQGFEFQASSWSPDGSRLAGTLTPAGEGPDAGVAVFSFGTRLYERLTTTGGGPMYLPDGRRLLFEDRDGIRLIEESTKRSSLIAQASVQRPFNLGTLSPDGRSFFTLRRTSQSDIWRMSFSPTR